MKRPSPTGWPFLLRMADSQKTEKAVFVGIIKQNEDERKVYEYLDELEFLAETAGATRGSTNRKNRLISEAGNWKKSLLTAKKTRFPMSSSTMSLPGCSRGILKR